MERLRNIGVIPINKDILYSLYSDLKRPDEKISELKQKELIIRVKRDLYVVSPKIHNQEISRELVANHLYGPSYISLESALSYYGLIPERVYSLLSICTKQHKQYNTSLGNFEYIKAPENYFPIGINQEIINNSYAFLIASPEKALCDKIVNLRNIRIQSVKAMREYLEDDLRFEMSALNSFNTDIIENCIKFGKKKTELSQLLKLLQNGKQCI
jgi:predicted transcriptional regulator of viral defense system